MPNPKRGTSARTKRPSCRASSGNSRKVRTPLIFCTHDGQPLRQGNVRREFLTLLSRCGLPHLRIHDLRHTFATHLIGSGFDPKTVGDLMGHSDPRMTLEIYTHAQESLKKRAALQAAQIGKPGAGSKSA
ncbi:hypothetical protein GCM10008956_05300 [Deinococcus arenae]|uniref:Tyr recombinase domain-containing protein n=1 Tax=Deinococcus arenae TaxID=1452751 RepID=A0A8H9GIV4_9DEIO|nr:tyrosine-type recombinase/integrase [Deinococcus arenae]GGM32066.1 hypothetical protein GCM10008956_05300 [Deinococcus arenae]